jgi:hypothetical protein
MFYSTNILTKKGPLGKIWLAAHFDKKLTKTQIFSTDIVNAVEQLTDTSKPLSLRLSGHLMLGLVRIYSRKVRVFSVASLYVFLLLLFSWVFPSSFRSSLRLPISLMIVQKHNGRLNYN